MKLSLLLHHFVVCNVLHDIYGIYLLVAYIVYSYFVFYSYLISGLIKFAMVTVCHNKSSKVQMGFTAIHITVCV